MAAVFDALGSPTRRRILDLVRQSPGSTVGEVAGRFDTTRIAVMHHLRQLEDCQLLISQKEGRQRRLYHNPVPIQMIYDRWTTEYGGFWAGKMADVKYAVERQATENKGGSDGRHRKTDLKGRDQGQDRGRVA